MTRRHIGGWVKGRGGAGQGRGGRGGGVDVHVRSMQNDSGRVGVVDVYVRSMQNDSGRVGSGQVGSEWLMCTFRACRMIRVGSGQSALFHSQSLCYVINYANDTNCAGLYINIYNF